MDDMVADLALFRDRRVLLTGDTGFKGSWLALWLHTLGAKVFGFALPPTGPDDHFHGLRLHDKIAHCNGDIRDAVGLRKFFDATQPEFVFHLAAQALVRPSYSDPKTTFDTNVGGSVNVLECVRASPSVRSLIYVTSDKCYRNNEWIWGYRENDPLGGHDPYSASKAAAEMVFSAYRDAFFQFSKTCGTASVRAGNVIGGGDWAEHRILPDCVRALAKSIPIVLRKPQATRPWQHVLEPLGGYLLLAVRLFQEPQRYSGAWNFGPRTASSRPVLELAQTVVKEWGRGEIQVSTSASDPHEAGLLHLNCDKAELQLNWRPRWNFGRTVHESIAWYRDVLAGRNPWEVSTAQILAYQESSDD